MTRRVLPDTPTDQQLEKRAEQSPPQKPLPTPSPCPSTRPSELTFYRQSVRRFVFSNNIPLTSLKPAEVVDLDLMHPMSDRSLLSDQTGAAKPPCKYVCRDGALEVSSSDADAASARYVGGLNPYAVYEVDIQSIDFEHPYGARAEIIVDFAHAASKTSLQFVATHPASPGDKYISLRVVKEGETTRETVICSGPSIRPPYKFQVQLAGRHIGVFYSKDHQTHYLGRTHLDHEFISHMDIRSRATALATRFCVRTNISPYTTLKIASVSSYLSAGIGQADIRLVTHADGAPFFSPSASADSHRLWFTFTIRGLGTGDGAQGVLSLDPSAGVADIRFEGVIVLDHGDGLLRNSYACHLFYHDEDRRWRAWFSDFGGAKDREGRGPTGLLVAESERDPRKGFSVMKARALKEGISGHHEDPCGVWDAEAGKWRLLTTELSAGMKARMWESEHWDGPWKRLGRRVHRNCTGTLIQKVGTDRFVFSGSSEGDIFVFSYPELEELGTLQVDLPPFSEGKNSRVWPNVVPLPSGYPARYIALMMDRANFPDVVSPTWSYGAMYLYWAHTEEISGEEYEFSYR